MALATTVGSCADWLALLEDLPQQRAAAAQRQQRLKKRRQSVIIGLAALALIASAAGLMNWRTAQHHQQRAIKWSEQLADATVRDVAAGGNTKLAMELAQRLQQELNPSDAQQRSVLIATWLHLAQLAAERWQWSEHDQAWQNIVTLAPEKPANLNTSLGRLYREARLLATVANRWQPVTQLNGTANLAGEAEVKTKKNTAVQLLLDYQLHPQHDKQLAASLYLELNWPGDVPSKTLSDAVTDVPLDHLDLWLALADGYLNTAERIYHQYSGLNKTSTGTADNNKATDTELIIAAAWLALQQGDRNETQRTLTAAISDLQQAALSDLGHPRKQWHWRFAQFLLQQSGGYIGRSERYETASELTQLAELPGAPSWWRLIAWQASLSAASNDPQIPAAHEFLQQLPAKTFLRPLPARLRQQQFEQWQHSTHHLSEKLR